MSIKCVICGHGDIKTYPVKVPGYVEGMDFEVYECKRCSSNFVDPRKIDKDLYDKIYSSSETPGYDRYYKYSQEIKKQADPLLYLAKEDKIYFPSYHLLKNKTGLKILEVGCGYGYLTYAINQSGNKAVGIDLSSNSIKQAKEQLGDFYINADLVSYAKTTEEKYDYIISHEVVEHVENVDDFLKSFIPLLKDNGQILLTTPNRDSAHPDDIWQTDAPPVHLTWIGKKGFRHIADALNLKPSFMNYLSYPFSGNQLMSYILKKLKEYKRGYKEQPVGPFLTTEMKIIPQKNYHSEEDKRKAPLKQLLKLIFVNIKPIKYISNLIYYYVLNKSDATLVIKLKKK